MADMNATADLLEDLWRQGKTLSRLPDELMPHDVDAGLGVQAAYLKRHCSCGWKIGPGPGGQGRMAAPLRGDILHAPQQLAAIATPAIEVEVGLVLGSNLPAGSTAEEAAAGVGGWHLALEPLRSRYDDPKAQPLPALLADNLSNAGLILGSGTPELPGSVLDIVMELHCGAERVAEYRGQISVPEIARSLSWLADYAAARGKPLAAGDVVITGARIGPVALQRGASYRATSTIGEAAFGVAQG